MVALPEPAVRFGVVVAAAVLWVAKGYALSVYRGEKEFKVTMAGKTLAIGVVGGAIAYALGNGTSGEALAMAVTFAVPVVDNVWNRFSSTWDTVEEYDIVEQFEQAANELANEYGDDAAEQFDKARRDLTGKGPTDAPDGSFTDAIASKTTDPVATADETGELTGDNVAKGKDESEPSMPKDPVDTPPEGSASTGTSPAEAAEKEPDPHAGKDPSTRVYYKVSDVPPTHVGYQKLRAVAKIVPGVNGLGTRKEITTGLQNHGDPQAVLDAFATVEAQQRGEERVDRGEEA